MVKCLPEFEYFTAFLKKNIIFKIRRSKVIDYAALKYSNSGKHFTIFVNPNKLSLSKQSIYVKNQLSRIIGET